MEEVNDTMHEEQLSNIIKILITRITHTNDKEEDEDNTIVNALKKVERLVGK